MYSKVKLFGHPIHPMLIAFPVALYTSTLVAYIIYIAVGDPFWFRVGFVANVAGVIMAAIAALPGFIDWAMGIPSNSPAKSTGLRHMLLNVTALVLFLINIFVGAGQLGSAVPGAGATVILALLGVLVTIAAGFLGWSLIQDYHVGVHLSPEEERLEAAAESRPIRT